MAQLTIPSGHKITAAEWAQILSYLQPLYARKTADETVTNSSTLQDDNELFVSVLANADYQMFGHFLYSAGTSEDFKLGWSGPSGATLDWNMGSAESGATGTTAQKYWGVNTISGTDAAAGTTGGSGTTVVAQPYGILRTSSTAGTFRFRWAQQAAGAGTPTTVRTGSFLVLHRLS